MLNRILIFVSVVVILLAFGCGSDATPPLADMAMPNLDTSPSPHGCERVTEDGGPCKALDAGPDMACKMDQQCAGACVDFMTDSLHCGNCATQCFEVGWVGHGQSPRSLASARIDLLGALVYSVKVPRLRC